MNNEKDVSTEAPTVVQPAAFKAGTTGQPQTPTPSTRKLKTLAFAIGLTALLFTLFIVIVVLPRWVEGPEVRDSKARSQKQSVTNTTPGKTEVQQNSPETIPNLKGMPESRKQTQDLLRETLEKLNALESFQAETWAKTDMHIIHQGITDGETAYREKRYVAAQNAYLDSAERIERLLKDVPNIVEKLTDVGNLALDNGQSTQATTAFNQVLAMKPDNQAATRGRARAKTLDKVLALIGQAEGYERIQQTDRALAAYRRALAVDSGASGASAAVERIERAQRKTVFQTAMSKGFGALDRNNFAVAREAFKQGEKLYPHAPEVQDALKQVTNAEVAFRIQGYVTSGERAEREEHWDKALINYTRALKIDPLLSSIRDAKRNAEIRHALNTGLNAHITQPDRLTSDAVHDEANAILGRAQAIESPGKILRQQILKLSQALTLARTPVAVRLRSDSITVVTIYRIGKVGKFENHEALLLPGKYTVIGKREGYRDTRIRFEVKPGVSGIEITVQCTEQFTFGS